MRHIQAAHSFGSVGLPTVSILAGVLLLAFGIYELVTRARDAGRKPKAAEWATNRELRALHVRGPEPGRVILGRHNRSLIAGGERASTLIAGLTQMAYKTSGLMIPNVLQWQGPVFSISVKGDVLRHTIAQRQKVGEVKVFDPAAVHPDVPRATWSPIAASSSWRLARRVASALLEVGIEPAGRSENEVHWRRSGADYLGPLLLAAFLGRKTMRDVLAWIKQADKDEAVELLQQRAVEGHQEAIDSLEFIGQADARYKTSVLGTLATSLAAWLDPSVSQATSSEDITIDWLLGDSGHNTLYIVGTEEEQEALAPLFGAMVAYLIGGAIDLAERHPDGRLERALLVGLDEVANTAPVAALDRYASAGASRGIVLITVVQNVSQLELRYGHAKAETILSNHAAKLFCAGLNDPASLHYVERVAGQQYVSQKSTHTPRGLASTGHSVTTATQLQPLVPPHALRQGDEATALLLYGRLAPAWVKLRRYFDDRELQRLAA
jgi:type IV secretion system protein VirD4